MARKTRTDRLFAPLCQRNPDFVVSSRYLVHTPVRHALSAVVLDNVGIAGLFRPRTFALPAFAMPPVFLLNDLDEVGWRYYRDEVFKLPKEELAEQVSADVEAAVLPTFRRLDSLDHLYEHAMGQPMEIWSRHPLHFRLELAMGNLDAAHMLMRWHRPHWETPRSVDGENFDVELRLCSLLEAGDFHGVAATLRAEEAKTFYAYGVDHLWQPTPFPIEGLGTKSL